MGTQTQFHSIESIELVKGSSRHNFPIHSHRVFCAGIVTNGQLIYQLDGEKHVLHPYDLYFVPAGVAHAILSCDGCTYEHYVVCIHENQLNNIPAADIVKDVEIGHLFLSLIQECMETGSEDKLLAFINELCSTVLQISSQDQETALVQDVLVYIQKHLDTPFSLDDLCADVSLSKYHLIRLVKKQCGLTPHQLYVQEKIRAVKSGILHADSTSDLAYRYQFTDQSHLCHVFKKYVGLTPTQYQKNRLT